MVSDSTYTYVYTQPSLDDISPEHLLPLPVPISPYCHRYQHTEASLPPLLPLTCTLYTSSLPAPGTSSGW
jgi:hypothetical protein